MDTADLGNMGYVPFPYAHKPSKGFDFSPYSPLPNLGYQPYEPSAEISALKQRLAVLEKRVGDLVALIVTLKDPSDPEGSSGAPAQAQAIRLPVVPEVPKADNDIDTLILAQRQFHQKSPWAYDVIN